MAPKFYGPYQITKKISQVAYELHLHDKIHIHNFFHVSCLKKMLGQHQTMQTILPMLDDEGRVIWNQMRLLQPEKKDLVFKHSRNISLGGKNFQMKMNHGRWNSFVNNIHPYP